MHDDIDQFDRDLDRLPAGRRHLVTANRLLTAAQSLRALDAADREPEPDPDFLHRLEEMLDMNPAISTFPPQTAADRRVHHFPDFEPRRAKVRGGRFAFLEFAAAALLIFALASAAYGGGAFDRSLPAVATPIPAATAGPTGMYRGDAGRTGVMPGPGPTGAPVLAWKTPVNRASYTAPVVAGDRLFFVEQDRMTNLGFVTCLDVRTGEKIWSWQVGAQFSSSPAVGDGLVFALTGAGLVALKVESGAVAWTYDAGETASFGSPAFANGLVYFTTDTRSLLAVDAETGQETWRIKLSSGPLGDANANANAAASPDEFSSSPAVSDGIVVAEGGNGYIMAADAMTGKELWRLSASDGYYPMSGPIIAGGVVYVGAVVTDPLAPNGQPNSTGFISAHGFATALDARTGSTIWKREGLSLSGGLAIDHGTVFVAEGPDLAAYDAKSGKSFWSFRSNAGPFAPVVAAGVVYLRADEGRLYGLDAATGKRVWEAYVGATGDPTVADGKAIVIGGTSVYAVGGDGSVTAPDTGDPKLDVSGLPPCSSWRTNAPNLAGAPSAGLNLPTQGPNPPYSIFNQILASNLPKGPSPDASQLAGVRETLQRMADCTARPESSGKFEGFYTDDFFRRLTTSPGGLEDAATRGFYSLGVQFDVSSAAVLPDGRIAAVVQGDGFGDTLLVFTKQDGHWLIDERYTVVAEYTKGAPAQPGDATPAAGG